MGRFQLSQAGQPCSQCRWRKVCALSVSLPYLRPRLAGLLTASVGPLRQGAGILCQLPAPRIDMLVCDLHHCSQCCPGRGQRREHRAGPFCQTTQAPRQPCVHTMPRKEDQVLRHFARLHSL